MKNNDEKAYKYSLWRKVNVKTNEIIGLEIKRLSARNYDLATNEETQRFFKAFGKTTFKYISGLGYKWESFSPSGEEKVVEIYYDTLEKLIDREGLKLAQLSPYEKDRAKSFYGKAQIIIYEKGGLYKELGLKSYDELAVILHSGEYMEVTGYYSPTTLRHINSYLYRTYFNYVNDEETGRKLTKKSLSKKKLYFFKKP